MKKHILYYCCVLVLLLAGQVASAQVSFHQSFKNPQVLQKPGWGVTAVNNTITRNAANGYAGTESGSLKIDFFNLHAGDIDSLKTPVFDPTVSNDSLFFDHAHVMAPSRSAGNNDSMDIMYSTDGGLTFSFLKRYIADPTPATGSLSTLPKLTSASRGGFTPVNPSDWASKAVALPVGTNCLSFIFYASGGDNLYLDNLVVGAIPASCSGIPVISYSLGTTVALCPGTEFYLSPDSFEYNPYVTYQWQQSPDDGATVAWTNVSTGIGYNTAEYSATYATPMYYRLTASCSAGGTDSTFSLLVTADSSYNCICKRDFGGDCSLSSPTISNVSFPSGVLNNSSACNFSPDYSSYSSYGFGPTTFDTITGGNPMATISITHNSADAQVFMWIDYNRNGNFENEEYYMLASAAPSGVANVYSYAVPASVNPGITLMRIRTINAYFPKLDSADACVSASFYAGETEDYLVYIKPTPVCNGTPVAGTLNVTSTNVCAGDKITLSSSGFTYGDGIIYTWEESDDNGALDPWTTVTSGTGMDAPVFGPGPIMDTIYYRLKVNCTHSSDSAYSLPTSVFTNPAYLCHCKSGLGGAGCDPANPYISHVMISGKLIDNTSACSNNRDNYTDYGFAANAYDTIFKGEEILLHVQTEVSPTNTAVWVDYNQDGRYTNDEFARITGYSTPGQPDSIHLFVPVNAIPGVTSMRIRTAIDLITPPDECNSFYWGETEDYLVYIADAPTCSGAPVTGMNRRDTVMVCSGDSTKLEVYGATYGDGIVYSWEQSTDAGVTDPWAAVATGTGFDSRSFYTTALTDTLYYRLVVSCTNTSNTTYGNPVMIAINSFYDCYCHVDLGGGSACASGYSITNVSIVNKNLNNNSSCYFNPIDGNYIHFAPTGTATDTLYAGGVYDLSTSVDYGADGQTVAAWIDFNHDGVFDASEYQLVTSNSSSRTPSVASFVVPDMADTGYTGMRLRISTFLGSSDACANIGFGETEDYTIYIQQTPMCSSIPFAGTIKGDTVVCPGMVFTLMSPDADFGTGIHYQWEESDDDGATDPWSVVSSTVSGSDTTRFMTVNGISSAKYYRFKDSCEGSGLVSYTASHFMSIDSFYSCYTQTANFGGDCAQHIANVTISGTALNNSSSCNSNSTNGTYSKFTPTGSATATLIRGASYDLSVLPSGFSSQNVGVWIDYNRNGHYETGEFTNIGNGNISGAASGQIQIKSYTPVGYVGMRIRSRVQGFILINVRAQDTTATYGGPGEVEDYVIYIDTLSPASNVTISNITTNSMDVSWTRGNGNGVTVIAKRTTSTLAAPVDGVDYHADASWGLFAADSTGTGNYVMYNGTGTSVTITDLDLLTGYDFYVYEYTGHGPDITYTTPASNSGTTLPVKLISFKGAASGTDAALNWITASEQNNKGFDVERSLDGRSFVKAGFVEGHNNSNVMRSYSYTDAGVFSSTVISAYYRLKQIDNNGDYHYSSLVYINSSKVNAEAVAYPNPFMQTIHLQFGTEYASKPATITIYNSLGVPVKTKLVILDKLANTEINDLEGLSNGIYIVNVQTLGLSKTYHMLKGE